MNQEIKERLHYYLPHALKCNVRVHFEFGVKWPRGVLIGFNDNLPIVRPMNKYGEPWDTKVTLLDWAEIKPHMRPLSSLTKEIIVEGYNDGKPFVAFHDLGKLFRYRQDENNVLNVLSEITKGTIDFRTAEKLFQWHFWIGDQALFDTGEIIRSEG